MLFLVGKAEYILTVIKSGLGVFPNEQIPSIPCRIENLPETMMDPVRICFFYRKH